MLMLTLTPLMFQQNVAAQERPKIFVDPTENIYYTDTTAVGFEFNVSIMSADWSAPGVFGFQFELGYDNSMLEAVAAVIPEGHWFTPTSGVPPGIFVVDPGTINHEEGYVSFGASLLAPEEGRTEGGIIAIVTLRITATPDMGKTLECALELQNMVLPDPSAVEIPADSYDAINGYFEFSAPPAPVYLKVEPSIVAASAVGDQVSITVMIYDVEEALRIIGAEFKIFFDPSILSITDVTEGDFFAAFGSTFFVDYTDTEYGVVGILLLPNATGVWNPPFPEGSGSLANIKFEVISIPKDLTEFPLGLDDVKIIDADLNIVTPIRLKDAVLMAPS